MTYLQNLTSASPRRLLRLPEVKQQVGLGRSAIYQQMKSGNFPTPVHIGARAVAWPSDQIASWIETRTGAVRDYAGAGSQS